MQALWGKTNLESHILNHCKKALELRHFNTRHNQVLKVMADFVRKQVPEDMQVIVDLENQYLFLTSLTYTDLRPDLVVCSNLTRTAILVELTVCFEDSFDDARARKEAKYVDLVDEIEENGFMVDLVTVEVGCP